MSVRHTSWSLAKVGVEVLDWDHYWLKCLRCGSVWSPAFPAGGHRFHRGWWKCQCGCNQDALKQSGRVIPPAL